MDGEAMNMLFPIDHTLDIKAKRKVHDDDDRFIYEAPDGEKLVQNAKASMKLDEALGLTRSQITHLWIKWNFCKMAGANCSPRIFIFVFTLMRGALNMYGCLEHLFHRLPVMLYGDLSKLPDEERVEMSFLRRHRPYWVTGTVLAEFAVLVFILSSLLMATFRYFRNRTVVDAAIFINAPRRLANFSALQFAMYMSPEVLMHEMKWFATSCFFLRARNGVAMSGDTTPGTLNFVSGSIALLAFLFFSFAGFVAFLTKLSFELGDIVWDSCYEWERSQWMGFICFINSCLGLVETDKIARERILLFRFAGKDATWTIGRFATMMKFERELLCITEQCLESKFHALAFMGTLTSGDVQYLLLDDFDIPGQEGPEQWMFDDTDSDDPESLASVSR